MNIYEVVKASAGRPIRRKSSPRIVGSKGDGWISLSHLIHNLTVSMDDLNAIDWEIMPESKSTVKRAQYLILPPPCGFPIKTNCFYKDDEEARNQSGYSTSASFVRLLETELDFDR